MITTTPTPTTTRTTLVALGDPSPGLTKIIEITTNRLKQIRKVRTCLTRFWKLTLMAAILILFSTVAESFSSWVWSDFILLLTSFPASASFSTLDRTSSSTFTFIAFSSAIFAWNTTTTLSSRRLTRWDPSRGGGKVFPGPTTFEGPRRRPKMLKNVFQVACFWHQICI